MMHRKKKYIGFIGINDVVAMIVREFTVVEIETNRDNLLALFNSKSDFQNLKCTDIIDLSSKNPYYPVDENASLQDAINLLVKWSVHLIPIVDSENGELKTLLTQSQVISFLQKHIDKAPFAQKIISTLQLGIQEVISINHNEMTIKAFCLIFEKKKFKALQFLMMRVYLLVISVLLI